MGMALSHGVPLRDMEFVRLTQPVCQSSGILMTEGCRGEGGILVNKNGYRYLQDCGMGPGNSAGRAEKQIYGTGSTRQSFSGLLARMA
ncbi:FAD-binding protein [Escherichia coli]